jgi:hypothetical protein
MNLPVTCSCGREADPVYEEVDIGVGVQSFHAGWECAEHGGICGVCGSCGVADSVGYTHQSWCREHPNETITAETFEAETDKLRDDVLARFKAATGDLAPCPICHGETWACPRCALVRAL